MADEPASPRPVSPPPAEGPASPASSRSGSRSSRGDPGWPTPPGDIVEVDDTLHETDSAIGDEQSSYTASLASSVVNYPVEHGRQYHAYRSGRYSRPNDEPEMERLILIHEIITRSIGGLYLAPIDSDKTKRILDVGTGSGIWAITMGDEFPSAEVIGNDLSANMPTFVPTNVKFEVDDVESDWLHEEKFSFIFSRYMAASIVDWPRFVNNIHENLEPGGWAEFQDFDLQYYSEDGSLTPSSPMHFWISTLLDAARSLNRDPNPGSKLKNWVTDAGFTNITHRRYKVPIGPWPRDPLLKEVGGYNYLQVNEGLEGLTLRLYTGVLGWSEQEILALLAKVRKDLNNPRVHAMFDLHVVYAQKA